MTRRNLLITLDSDALFTASSASVGRPDTLKHLPGASLLGAAAAACYHEFTPDEALRAFHLGAVRFGDGLPYHPSLGASLPVPLSWHSLKEGDSRTFDLSQQARPAGQVKQKRDDWVSASGSAWQFWRPRLVETMRTAIDEGGGAREGLLYGFVAVAAGTTFIATVEGDDEKLVDRVVGALCGRPLYVGRSRTAEFGRATVSAVDPKVTPVAAMDAKQQANPGLLRVFCVSDLALIDESTGGPRLLPSVEDFGLSPKEWTLDLSKSFFRFRQYSPYNGARKRPDSERQVIEAGSVITFSGAGASAALAATRDACAGGVGAYRSYGLGRVSVEPVVLAALHPQVGKLHVESEAPVVVAPSSPLVDWMKARRSSVVRADQIWQVAEAQAVEAAKWGISRSQWGQLRSMAGDARARDGASFAAHLKRHLTDGVTGDIWKKRGADLCVWFADQERSLSVDGALAALQLLARRVPRHEKLDSKKGKAADV
jgi:hypothetical protein